MSDSKTETDGDINAFFEQDIAFEASDLSIDDQQLLRLGKKPVLRRAFGLWAILGFSCTVLITWEGALIVCSSTLLNGGPAGVIWGFVICWIGSFSTFLAIGELASMAPLSSGQYHWVALLSPPSAKPILSYLTGWVTVIGWQAVNTSSAFLTASAIQATAALVNPTYSPRPWQTVLLSWAVIAFTVVVNIISSRALARFEGFVLILHLLGFLGILIPLVYYGPHSDASTFLTLYNGGGWGSDGLSFMVGIPALIFSIFGADSAVHMSEEIQNASIVVPRALVLTMTINGTLGFAMLVALMFCLGDITAALDAIETLGFAYLEIFSQALQSTTAAAAMSGFIIVMAIFAAAGAFAASTRLLWAFARDNGPPFSRMLAKVHPRSALPLNTIMTTMTVTALIVLIALGSSVALNAILSLSIAGLYSSYLICCALLLWRRVQGKIGVHDSRYAVVGPSSLRWGPWRIPEPFGTINNGFACVYLAVFLFWSFWPPFADVTASNMNFSCLMFGAVVLFSVFWYILRARKYYDGPIVEL